MNKFAIGHMATIPRRVGARTVAVGSALALLGSQALAAVPADVTTELTAMKADGLTVAGIVLVAIIALFAFKFMRKGL